MTSKPDAWVIKLTIVVPHVDAPTLDEAIDLVGEKLHPLSWSGRITEQVNMEEAQV